MIYMKMNYCIVECHNDIYEGELLFLTACYRNIYEDEGELLSLAECHCDIYEGGLLSLVE